MEAEQAVRRLRNHASLALWNGNNEMEWGWVVWGWKDRYPGRLWDDYEKIFHDLLPGVVARHDPTRSYWPSRPSAGGDTDANSPDNGDMHYWGVWHASEPFETYEQTPTRFMSEYGFQSFPEMRTIRSFAGPNDLDHRLAGDDDPPEAPPGEPAHPGVHAPRLPGAEGLRLLPLREPGPAGRGRQARGRVPPALAAAHHGLALLAAQRLLAGGLVGQHRLLRPLEGAAVLRAAVLRGRPGEHRRGGGRGRGPRGVGPDRGGCPASSRPGSSTWTGRPCGRRGRS